MKSVLFFSVLFLKGFLVSHKFFSISCCTFELNLKCISDKLVKPFPVPLAYMKTLLHFWIESKMYFWQIGTPFSSFPLHENLVSKGKEQKNNRKWIWNSKKKKNQNIGAHFDLHCTIFANISEKVNRLTQP